MATQTTTIKDEFRLLRLLETTTRRRDERDDETTLRCCDIATKTTLRCFVVRWWNLEMGHRDAMPTRVEDFGRVVAGFTRMKVEWVKELGFGGLLELKRRRYPRSLCYWLMTSLDVEKKVIQLPSGVEYPLDRNQVHWVLGNPCRLKWVPKEARNDDCRRAVEAIRLKYGMGVGIPMVKVVEKVEGSCGLDDEYEFKTAFLILALCDVLCPTNCRRLESDLVIAATFAMDASSYDSSTLIIVKLLLHGRHFADKFYKDGYAKVGGDYADSTKWIGCRFQGGGGVCDMNENNVVAESESDGELNVAQRQRGPRDNLNPYQQRVLRRVQQVGVNVENEGFDGGENEGVQDGENEGFEGEHGQEFDVEDHVFGDENDDEHDHKGEIRGEQEVGGCVGAHQGGGEEGEEIGGIGGQQGVGEESEEIGGVCGQQKGKKQAGVEEEEGGELAGQDQAGGEEEEGGELAGQEQAAGEEGGGQVGGGGEEGGE
ncbi:hypothetical protein BVRB_5g105860 [Beta vulgaris subsp. vulgaris]|nr:hypothetical protein BVRB_5g105860 [Beta vulgaris subsp. vulgaris]